MATQFKPPTKRRKYHPIVGVTTGLDYSKPSTMIADTACPSCEEVTFRNSVVDKAMGNGYFASTNTTPILGTFLHAKRYILNNESEKLVVHSSKNVYAYNSTSLLLECITRGVVVENCEDVWSVNANVTCAVSTNCRKGTYSIAVTIAAAFTTGIAAYENFSSVNLSTYDHLHFYIKSDVATTAGQLRLRLSGENAGGTGATYADYNVPALVAGVWQEVSVALASPDADNGGTYPTDLNAVLSISLVVVTDIGAQVVNIDDVLATIETTGDEDDPFVSLTLNGYHIYSNGIAPLLYWDMTTDTTTLVTGCDDLACHAMEIIGERLCLYHVPDYPRRIQWTVVGGVTIPPAATDWTDTGSGNTDLDSVFGDDVIQTAVKLGAYVVIYGKKTIAMQEYTGISVADPYDVYPRVTNVGTPSRRGAVNIGTYHIFLGYNDVYVYKGGTDVESIGAAIRDELFTIINPEYIHRSFVVYLKDRKEVQVHFPLVGSSIPNCYFSYNVSEGSWTRGSRSYTGFGSYRKSSGADTWDTIATAKTTWDEMATRWNDYANEALSDIHLFGNLNGKIFEDNQTLLNLAGAAIDGWWETKDLVIGDGYRRNVTNWMSLSFEAKGDSVNISYSKDLGVSWSTPVSFTLVSEWTLYTYDFGVNSPSIRFRFRNSTLSETFSLRFIEVGYIEGSDRAV